MSLSIYELTIPALFRGFNVLSSYVGKASEFVRTHDIDPNTLLQARLAPDMLSFTGQIQRASDQSKNGIARITGVEAPRFEDTEASFEDLQERIGKTIAFLSSINEFSFEGASSRPIDIKFRSINGLFTGATYTTSILLPDFYFHVATAHAILRSQGVTIGKTERIHPTHPPIG